MQVGGCVPERVQEQIVTDWATLSYGEPTVSDMALREKMLVMMNID